MPLLMGIVNVTPDSFSDGGQFFDPDDAVEHGLRLVEEGADLLDIGGESTRPGAAPVEIPEELRRVMPVLGALRQKTGVPISIDTTKAIVARHALNAGAEIINDTTGLEGDPAMLPLAAESGAGVCVMHAQGTPRTMQDQPTYAHVVAEVLEYLRRRRDALLAAGIPSDRIAVDPGIGFGKTTAHNLQLLANAWQFHTLGCPVLFGHSRKRFLADIAAIVDTLRVPSAGASVAGTLRAPSACYTPADPTVGTIGVALSLARQGVQILRVHDVSAVRQALAFFRATGGMDECALSADSKSDETPPRTRG
jgi:dihydropteroate synthase